MNEAKILLERVILLSLVWLVWSWRQGKSAAVATPAKEKVERSLRGRSPEDCPVCQSG